MVRAAKVEKLAMLGELSAARQVFECTGSGALGLEHVEHLEKPRTVGVRFAIFLHHFQSQRGTLVLRVANFLARGHVLPQFSMVFDWVVSHSFEKARRRVSGQ